MSHWNRDIKEGPAQFGTTFEVAQRFTKSESHVRQFICDKWVMPRKKASLHKLRCELDSKNVSYNHALHAITNFFGPLRHMQTTMGIISYASYG